MCYSAMVEAGNKKLGLRFKARVDTSLLERQYRRSLDDDGFQFKVLKAYEANFLKPAGSEERTIKELIGASSKTRS